MEQNRLRDNPLLRFVSVILIPLIALAYIYFGLGTYYSTVFILFFINLILAVSLNLTNGITGIFSLGMAAFMGIGAYVSSLLSLPEELKVTRIEGIPGWLAKTQLPFWASLLIAGLFTMVIAAFVGFVILRAKGHYLAVITLGLVVVIKNLLDNLTQFTNGARGISGMFQYATLPVVVVAALIILYILYRIKNSSYGRSMIALRDDEDAAESLGINYLKIRLMSFMLSAFFGAIGGALWAHLMRSIAPSMFYFDETFSILEMSVIGGMSTLTGGFVGAAIMTFLPQLLANFETGFTIFGFYVPAVTGLSAMVTSILFLIIIIGRKGGIVRSSEYITDTLFRKETYVGLFRKKTYTDLIDALLHRKSKSVSETEK